MCKYLLASLPIGISTKGIWTLVHNDSKSENHDKEDGNVANQATKQEQGKHHKTVTTNKDLTKITRQ